jgi:hypothetical protein
MPITLNGTTGVTYPDGVLQGSGVPTASATSGAPVVSNGTIYTQSTAVAVAFGGTGATTLTGVLKGNGTSAFSAATAGTDFVAPGGALGTPSSGTLTNCTGYSASNLATGTLPAARLPAGSVLQVLQATKTDTQSFSGLSTSWADITGLSVTITPRNSSSRVIIMGSVMVSIGGNPIQLKLVRNGSDIFVGDAAGSRKQVMTQLYGAGSVFSVYTTANYVDSPATASAVTYKWQLSIGGSFTDYVNRCVRDQDGSAEDARGASNIIVMEIAG